MSWEIELETDFSDLDSFGNLPISALFFWAQKCRMQVYISGVLGEFRKSSGVLMVKAQTFQFEPLVEPVKAFTNIVVTQKVAAVGKTSMTFALEFKIKATGTIFARGIVIMVCVAGGKAQEIPLGIKSSIMAEVSSNGAKLKESLEQEIAKMQSGLESPSKDQKKSLTMEVLLRLSDEDANSHVRHTRYVHFFEDALALNERRIVPLKVMSVEYVKETRGGEKCLVEMWENTSEGCARFEMKRDKNGEVVCKGLARF